MDKEIKDCNGNIVKLNENEFNIYSVIADGDEYNGRATMHYDDIVEMSGFSNNQTKGYLLSLVKKNVIMEVELPEGMLCCWQVIKIL